MTAAGGKPAKRRFGNSALVAIGILTSRLFGILRETLRAKYLGASGDIVGDAWTTAIRIPNILQNLLGEGVLSASFVPVYARLLADGDEEEAGRVAGAIGAILGLITAVIVLVGILCAPAIVRALTLGSDWTPEKTGLTVTLTRILFPGAALFVMGAWCIGVLNSHRRFLLAYLAPVMWNVAMIVAFLWFGSKGLPAERVVVAVAWASVVGAALQFLVQLPLVVSLAKRLKVSFDHRRASVRRVLKNFGPVGLSRGVVQVSGFVDLAIANVLPQGSATFLATAQTVNMLPVSLFGMAVSASELPELSSLQGTAEERHAAIRARVMAGARRIAFFVIPSAVAFVALGDVIIRLLYERGKWLPVDTMFTWGVLAGSGVGLVASTIGRLYSSAFYALHEGDRPLRYALVRVALGISLGFTGAILITPHLGVDRRWGAAILAVTSGVAGWVEFWLLRRALMARVGDLRMPAADSLKLWAIAGLAAAIGFGVKTFAVPALHDNLTGVWRSIAEAALVLGAFGVAYLTMTSALRIPEARSLTSRLRR